MSHLRAGVVGCGARGAWSVARIRDHGQCEVVAACDPDPAAREHLRTELGVGILCEDHEQLLQTGVDFVVLASPPGLHLEQVLAAAAQGVHCLLHAPMARNGSEAAAMVAAADRGGVRLGVLVPGQGDPMLDELRQMITDDFLGAPVLAHCMHGDDRAMRNPAPAGHWRRDPALAGGNAFLQLAAEEIHLAAWLLGRDATAVGAQASMGFTAQPQDTAAATAVLRGGALLTVATSHLCRGRAFMVHGTDGAALVGIDRLLLRGRKRWPGPLLPYPQPFAMTSILRAEAEPAAAAQAAALEPHARFARWIDDRDGFPCPAEQGLQDMLVLDALGRAMRSGATEPVTPGPG